MTSAWPYPGAKWYKFDFHTHTPKSTDSMWAKHEHNLSPQDWLLKLTNPHKILVLTE
ncbi:hypothetical protein VTH8203_04495 [Vibrio thalassae]|uniref:Uncharacterized protein n=1 Tax=Vibrio thalassae TaxID=1243014 RepID=A0A240EQL6_9VIBR|nr:hypothetical protein VTH8203_04495 [Vibrio thalassae]